MSPRGIGTNVVLDNESTTVLAATVNLAGSAMTASSYPLTAPSLSSKTVTLAGSAVTASAAFHPIPQSLTIAGNAVTVAVPAGSAVLIVTG